MMMMRVAIQKVLFAKKNNKTNQSITHLRVSHQTSKNKRNADIFFFLVSTIIMFILTSFPYDKLNPLLPKSDL